MFKIINIIIHKYTYLVGTVTFLGKAVIFYFQFWEWHGSGLIECNCVTIWEFLDGELENM